MTPWPPASDMEAARALLNAGDVAAGLDRLGVLADSGDGEACAQLAALHALGAGAAKHWPTALGLLRRAAALGHADAQAQLDILAAEGAPDRAAPRTPLCEAPRVRRIDGFLNPAACDWLIGKARGRLVPASTLEAGQAAYNRNRTNSAFAFSILDSDCVLALARHRAAAALNMPEAAFEMPQVFHYATGQTFRPHVDYLPPTHTSQRIATFLVYLNDGFEGGETWFQRPDLKAKAGVGGALYFANVDPSGAPDPHSLHAGLAPTQGEKWLLSQWVHDRAYVA